MGDLSGNPGSGGLTSRLDYFNTEKKHEFARISLGDGSRRIFSLGTGCLQRMIHGNKLVPVFALSLRWVAAEQAEVQRTGCVSLGSGALGNRGH